MSRLPGREQPIVAPALPRVARQMPRRKGDYGEYHHHQDGRGEHLHQLWHGSVSPITGAGAECAPTCLREEEAGSLTSRSMNFEERFAYILVTKIGNPFEVQLSDQAVALLRHQRRCTDRDSVFLASAGNVTDNWNRWLDKARASCGFTENWIFRRSGATVMGRLGVPDSIVDLCLNHRPGKITRTYNKSDYKPEMADAFQ
jgi:integrase